MRLGVRGILRTDLLLRQQAASAAAARRHWAHGRVSLLGSARSSGRHTAQSVEGERYRPQHLRHGLFKRESDNDDADSGADSIGHGGGARATPPLLQMAGHRGNRE